MDDHDRIFDGLPDVFASRAKAAVPDGADISKKVEGRLAARRRPARQGPLRFVVVPLVALVAVALGGVFAAAAVAGEAPIQFALHMMPNRAPDIARPGAPNQIPCKALAPETTTIEAARQSVAFPVLSLSSDSQATLVGSTYVYGCDGAKGLNAIYMVGGSAVEIAEGRPSSGTGPYYLNLKAVPGKTAAQLGWSTVQIAGHDVAIHISPSGKGYIGGVDQAVWQTRGTLLTVGPYSLAPSGSSPGLTMQTLTEVVTNLTTG